jgi:Protein of unknown function (DUF4038)/Putative collagen-binding domain of a collagenase
MTGAICSRNKLLAQMVAPTSDTEWPKAEFPLSIPAGKRYLEDAAGRPFLIHGDTAWSLIAQLTLEDAERYLLDRRARGFNAILVNLLEHMFSTKSPANIYGEPPFLRAGAFSASNEPYFAHADKVLRLAADNGILVLLAPAYVGSGGGPQGWYQGMLANTRDQLREYGQFLGRRYAGFANIIWVHGGDFNPPDKDRIRAIAEGIREFDTRALHTAHCAPETAALDYWKGEPWLQLNNVYTYKTVHISAIEQYQRPERMPFFLIESAYENEHRADERRIRSQAYDALLSGASGHIYGNNPIWHFDGPGLYPAPSAWQEALESPGARSMTHVRALFASLPWWRLVPDAEGTLLTGDVGTGQERAVAAITDDRSLAVFYLPSSRAVHVNLLRLAGRNITARWYAPAEGRSARAQAVRTWVTEAHSFDPPPSNGGGEKDWVLVLAATG